MDTTNEDRDGLCSQRLAASPPIHEQSDAADASRKMNAVPDLSHLKDTRAATSDPAETDLSRAAYVVGRTTEISGEKITSSKERRRFRLLLNWVEFSQISVGLRRDILQHPMHMDFFADHLEFLMDRRRIVIFRKRHPRHAFGDRAFFRFR